MKFDPTQDTDVDSGEWPLLQPGDYPFSCLASDEVASKSEKNKGKLMFVVKLNVHGPKSDQHCWDRFAPSWLSPWKVKHFAATVGLSADYEKGELNGANNAFAGKVGYVNIGIEPAQGNFPAKNVVKDYIVRDAKAKPAVETPPDDSSDQVPF